MSFEIAIQQSIYNTLTANVPVASAVISINDDVDQPIDSGSADDFPYIVIGDDSVVEWDTDTELGADATIVIHTWSRQRGKKETKEIQGLIYNALHRANLTVTGYTLVGIDWIDSQTFLDGDGKTRHGVQTFRITIDQL